MIDSARVEREKAAYDEGTYQATRDRRRSLYRYVYGSPNSLRAKATWQGLVRASLADKQVLEVGCGEGWDCKRFLEWGAREVHGIDLSTSMLAVAKQHEGPNLKFFEHDLHQPWPHVYDVIVGRSILHHLDYRTILTTLYERNLAPGGRMVFVEPLGHSPLMRLYWRFGGDVHTPDERPFTRSDIQWLQQRFEGFRLLPTNLLSIPASLFSWLVGLNPNNPLTRAADSADVFLAEKVAPLRLHYRSAVFDIVKPITPLWTARD